MKKTRLITTFRCDRSCDYCVMKHKSIISQIKIVSNLSELKDYDEINLTGGEPLLYPNELLGIIRLLKRNNPDVILHLYATIWNTYVPAILDEINGILFTLHNADPGDEMALNEMQKLARHRRDKTFRLSLNPSIDCKLMINPSCWELIKVKRWLPESELCLPEGSLYAYKPE